jgi:hypothetical protein
MSTYELNLRIDNSIPFHKIPTFPRFRDWKEADSTTTSGSEITVKLVTPDEILGLSSRWDTTYTFGVATETDEAGKPVFTDMPHGTVDAEPGLLTCSLQKGTNYILAERTGGILRDYKVGEVVLGTSVWSKAKVSAFLIVTVE